MADQRTKVSRASYDFMLAYLDDYPGPRPNPWHWDSLMHLPEFSQDRPELPSNEAREHYKRIADKYRAASIAKRKAQTQERPAPAPPAQPAANVRAPRTAEQEAALQAEVLKCVSPGTYRAHKQGVAARDGMVAQFAARRDEDDSYSSDEGESEPDDDLQ